MKFTVIGFILWAVGFFLYVFKLVSLLTGKELKIFSIQELFGLNWVVKIPGAGTQGIATYIATSQLAIVLFSIGFLFISVGVFKKE